MIFQWLDLDDSEISKVVDPPLTTIKAPTFEMGNLAVEKLCTMTQPKDMELEEIPILPCELIIRSSTGECNQKN